jgi:ABC-type sugar transport system ATPase subunit
MSVHENMAFGLKMRGADAAGIEKRVSHAADVLKIEAFLDRRPAQLSGGQRQRVAMGRAIVREPAAFLFDEPLSNLDAALRVEMRLEIAKLRNQTRIEIKRLQRQLGATVVFVTHDQVEAMTLADRIVVMNGGVVEQIGAPLELYHRPASLFVARFIGSPTMNTVPAEVLSPNGMVEVFGRTIALENAGYAALPKGEIVLGIRPEDFMRCRAEEAWFSGELVVAERLGSQTYGYVDVGHSRMLSVEFPRDMTIAVGETIHVRGDMAHIQLFSKETERRLD